MRNRWIIALSAIHGRILTTWGCAGVAGPMLVSWFEHGQLFEEEERLQEFLRKYGYICIPTVPMPHAPGDFQIYVRTED